MSDSDPVLKKDRRKCYESRDKFFVCYDIQKEAGKSEDQAIRACRNEKKLFDADCPASWVGHFIRKHNFEKYKEQLIAQGVNIADKNALEGNKKPFFFASFVTLRLLFMYESFSTRNFAFQNSPPRSSYSSTAVAAPVQRQLLGFTKDAERLTISDERFVQKHLFNSKSTKITPLIAQNLMTVTRKYHLYDDGFTLLSRILDPKSGIKLNISTLVEASIFLGNLCCRRLKDTDQVYPLALQLWQFYKTLKLPPLLSSPIEISLNYVMTVLGAPEAVAPNRNLLLDNGRLKESHFFMALMHLENVAATSGAIKEEWDYFRLSFNESRASILSNPCLFIPILQCRTGNRDLLLRMTTDWLYETLCEAAQPIAGADWPFLESLNKSLKVNCTRVRVKNDGSLDLPSSLAKRFAQVLKLPAQELPATLIPDVLSYLRDKLSTMKRERAEITLNELQHLEKRMVQLKSKLKEKQRVIIVDTLNLAYKSRKFDMAWVGPFIRSMEKHFAAIVFITKPHAKTALAKALHQAKPNDIVEVFSSLSDRAHDDLLSIFAAGRIGEQAWILTNDQFKAHVELLREDGDFAASEKLAQWINRRSIRHSGDHNSQFAFDEIAFFNRDVRWINCQAPIDKVLFLPVCHTTEQGQIQKYEYHVAFLPS
ncbi:unnamed protein product, partial [Mesorhabditis spiculigera]